MAVCYGQLLTKTYTALPLCQCTPQVRHGVPSTGSLSIAWQAA
jgi:hypothetical protein